MAFCNQCGQQLEEDVQFCTQCGAVQSLVETPVQAKSKKPFVILAVVASMALCAVGGYFWLTAEKTVVPDTTEELATVLTYQEQYDLGMKYLSEGNYEEAIIAFTAAIELEPMEVGGYLGLADVYIALGDTESAVSVLEQGYERTGDEVFVEYYRNLITPVFEGTDYAVSFPDTNFEHAIRMALDLPEGDIMASDCYVVTTLYILGNLGFQELPDYYTSLYMDPESDVYTWEYFVVGESTAEEYIIENTDSIKIQSIEGLEYFPNLIDLDIHYTAISDVTPLAGLTQLKSIDLDFNNLRDISTLSNLVNLESQIRLNYNNITDVSPLTGLTALSWIELMYNNIESIDGFEALVNLEQLYIQGNPIRNLDPLSNLTLLFRVDVDPDNIIDWAPVAHVEDVSGRSD